MGSLSTQILALRMVAANGEVVECSAAADSRVFRAAQLALGSLGVITAVRLRLLPLYRLHEQVRREPIAECLAGLEGRIRTNRHFEFFWYPGDDCALTKTLNPTDRLSTGDIAGPSAERAPRWRVPRGSGET